MPTAMLWMLVVLSCAVSWGCKSKPSRVVFSENTSAFAGGPDYHLDNVSVSDSVPASRSNALSGAPPRVRDIRSLTRQPMSLDEAVSIALRNNSVVRSSGGHVLAAPKGAHTPFDPAIIASDPRLGSQAALSAFDMQLESTLFWNGGGPLIAGGYGPFGVYSQPATAGTVGVSKTLSRGTRVNIGAVGGYDSDLASGLYAAFGGEMRHPLLRRSGYEFNQIAGPYGELGNYRGVWIARIDEQKSGLELEHAVRDLVRDVALTYWELYFAYRNLDAQLAALDHARQSWHREKERANEEAAPPDFEALARQQYYTSDANVQNAISGTGPGQTGIYNIETKLRLLLGLPTTDGVLIWPADQPLEADFRFAWNESQHLAQIRRVELRKQQAEIQKRELELRAARNLQRPQVDFVGQYRRLADNPGNDTPLFSEALQGWRIGLELRRAHGNRRENAAVRNAELRLNRDHALLDEQQLQISSQLRVAFTELDRAFGVTQCLAASRDAAMIRLQAEEKRHQAGDTHIERVLEAQDRATHAETSYLRSLVDFNLAFINIHLARGTLLETLGVGFSERTTAEPMLYSQHTPSVFTASNQRSPSETGHDLFHAQRDSDFIEHR